ncbi:MAG: epoxyqueuosine reductase QueH [Candidatus Omnitrophota bacterium]
MSSPEIQKHVLLHVCCAPCIIYPLKKLKLLNYKVTGFFYNPNIQPEAEYALRKKNIEKFSQCFNCDIIYAANYTADDFFQAIGNAISPPERCQLCWELRLKQTAHYAKENNFDLFTSTLLVSPYQDRILLKQAGEKTAREQGVEFLFYDFSEGYPESVTISRELGMYRQKYCGCKYSLEEKTKEKKIKDKQ